MKCVGLLPTAINEGSLATSTTTKKHWCWQMSSTDNEAIAIPKLY